MEVWIKMTATVTRHATHQALHVCSHLIYSSYHLKAYSYPHFTDKDTPRLRKAKGAHTYVERTRI